MKMAILIDVDWDEDNGADAFPQNPLSVVDFDGDGLGTIGVIQHGSTDPNLGQENILNQ